MFEMLQKSNTHWCHYSQGERGMVTTHLTAGWVVNCNKIIWNRQAWCFYLVHKRPLLQQSFENHYFVFLVFFFAKLWHSWAWKHWNTEQEKSICSWIKAFMSVNENMYVLVCIYSHMFCICRQIHWIIFTWSRQLQLQNPESQPKAEWFSCHRTQVKCPKRDHTLSSSHRTTPSAAHMATEVLKNLESKIWGQKIK